MANKQTETETETWVRPDCAAERTKNSERKR